MTAVPLRPVRRWIHARQTAHRERGATLSNVYLTVLTVAIVGAMLHEQVAGLFWPADPGLSGVSAIALATICAALLFQALRALGPVTLSRPAAYFLLTAPVSRRRLLLPSVRLTAAAAAIVGAAAAFAILGHADSRDSTSAVVAMTAAAALLGLIIAVLAGLAQARSARLADRLAALALGLGVATLVAGPAGWTPPTLPGRLTAAAVVPLAGVLALIATAGLIVLVRGLARTRNDRILESAKTAGTLFDAAFGMEPSWVTDMVARRYWANRRLRTTRPPARLPVLTGQDYLLALRRPGRLLWLLLGTTVPLVLTSAPGWLLGAAVLSGAMIAGGTTTATVKTDAGNPVLLRMLGLNSRQAMLQRFWVPAVLSTVWATVAMTLLQVTGALPAPGAGGLGSGPWWALGLAAGPIGALAALRRARVGFVRNDLLPLDTGMGTLSTGPLLNSVAGPDVLLLGFPMLVVMTQPGPPTWTLVVFQAGLTILAARAYFSVTTADDRVELSAR